MSEHYRKLERMYLSAPTNKYYLPKLRIEKGKATLQIKIRPDFFHAAGAIHGSIYFKCLDDAGFFAVNSLVEDVFVYTAAFDIRIKRPASKGVLRSEGKVTTQSSRLYKAESILYLEDGTVAAKGTGTFMRSDLRLADVPGYK